MRVATMALVVTLIGASLWLASMMFYYTMKFPDPFAVSRNGHTPVIRILARDGGLLAERGTAHPYMPIDMLPPHVLNAVVATEDRRFFSHWGIDPAGMFRAMLANIRKGRFAQGGSTLTQQLAKNMFLSQERTLTRKLDELALAFWLEYRLDKRQILELYLNRVYFGGGAYGIEAASQRFFGKSARALSISEAALVAGLLKAPSRYAPTANPGAGRARGRSVLRKMRAAGLITNQQLKNALSQPIRFARRNQKSSMSGKEYVVDYVLDRLPRLLDTTQSQIVVETTIDATLQTTAQKYVAQIIRKRGTALKASQAALVAMDREGGIRALVGGVDYRKSQFNRAASAYRQPGSTFKPFVYLTALEAGYRPETITYDLPLSIKGWTPRNANGRNIGTVTLRDALAKSINTVAVRLALEAGPKAVADTAKRLGIKAKLRADPSLALGTSEVPLLEMVGAYNVFASGGRAIEPHIIHRIRTDEGRILYARPAASTRQIVKTAHVGAMNDMLNAALVAGTGRRAALAKHPASGKTGTSQDFRDAWFIGYTAHMTAGVWIGNDNGKPMRKVSGGSLPAEIWRAVMTQAHKDKMALPLPYTSRAGAVISASSPIYRPGAQRKQPRLKRASAPPRATARTTVKPMQVVKKPPLPARRPTRLRTQAPRHPTTRITTKFIADILNMQPNTSGRKAPKRAVATNRAKVNKAAPAPPKQVAAKPRRRAPSGFDINEIKQRLSTMPAESKVATSGQPAPAPGTMDGMMGLGGQLRASRTLVAPSRSSP